MSTTKDSGSPDCGAESGITTPCGRRVAGADPFKREQILDGAKRIFMRDGFNGASMNDITREAGVSKGTIYVYFENKEDLFGSLIERERARFVATVRDMLNDDGDVETVLHDFGVAFCSHLTNADVIASMRIMLGVIDRMPNLSRKFFTSGPYNVRTVLQDYLVRQVSLGRMKITDIELAARQFIELSSGSFFKLRLFGEMQDMPPRAEIERVASSAVALFMLAYGSKATPAT